MLHMVNSDSNHCLFSELPSASVTVRHTRTASAADLLEFEVFLFFNFFFKRVNFITDNEILKAHTVARS